MFCNDSIKHIYLLKYIIPTILVSIIFQFSSSAQTVRVFEDRKILNLVDKGAYYVYNELPDSANHVIDRIEKLAPSHPLIPMMRAMNIAWTDQPFRTTSPYFPDHELQLNLVISYADKILDKDSDNLEALFFKMSSYGLLAEYYANEGSYMKAVSLAKNTYSLIKETMDRGDEIADVYFLAGLYNYFREKYVEKHPVYASFLWLFMSGDIERGLKELDIAVHQSKIVKAEAHIYSAFVYLRYENNPQKALYYLEKIHKEYPKNSYFKAKYLESLILTGDYEAAMPFIEELKKHKKPYYRMCAHAFLGVYNEQKIGRLDLAKLYYNRALDIGEQCLDQGNYYRSVSYLGLGKIAESKKKNVEAIKYYNKAILINEDDDTITYEAEQGLERLD